MRTSSSAWRAQVLELPTKGDKIVDFAWEPHGTRFALLHGDGSRPNLSLYEMRDMRTSARGVQLVATQPNKQVNCLHWSPQVRAPCLPRQRACAFASRPGLDLLSSSPPLGVRLAANRIALTSVQLVVHG